MRGRTLALIALLQALPAAAAGLSPLEQAGKKIFFQQFPISRYALFLGGMRESAFVNFLEQSHDAAGGWPRYGEPPAVV